MIIRLNSFEMAELYKTKAQDRNNGGFQGFMVRMQDRLDDKTGDLELNSVDVARIDKYFHYDQGGYESRLRKIFGRHLPSVFGEPQTDLFDLRKP